MTIPDDTATIRALRSDVALQIARYLQRQELSQAAAAKSLRIPQPTLSKIANGRVSDLSLELLLRIAVRAGLHLVLQIGAVPGALDVQQQTHSSKCWRMASDRTRLADPSAQ